MEDQQHVTDIGRHDAPPGPTSADSPEDPEPPRSTACPRSRSEHVDIGTRCRIRTGDTLVEHGMRLSGLSPDGSLVEMIELSQHPWFIGCQFHPGASVAPNARPHPLFAGSSLPPRRSMHAADGQRRPTARRARPAVPQRPRGPRRADLSGRATSWWRADRRRSRPMRCF